MGDGKIPDRVNRAAAKRRGHLPGDKVVNRSGGGTPPSQTVSNPERIAGIKTAFMEAVRDIDGSDWLCDHVAFLLGLRYGAEAKKMDEGDMDQLRRVIASAKEEVKDWAKLPVSEVPGLHDATLQERQPRTRVRLDPPKVLSRTTMIPAITAPSQIEQALTQGVAHNVGNTQQLAAPPTTAVRSIPADPDIESARRMGALIKRK